MVSSLPCLALDLISSWSFLVLYLLFVIEIGRSVPVVLGTKPTPSKGHSSVVLNKNRILILKIESSPGDCTWFLEVCALQTLFILIFQYKPFVHVEEQLKTFSVMAPCVVR